MDLFQTACGASPTLVLEIEGPSGPQIERRSFAQPFVLIGRENRADVQLEHDLVSQRHAYLQVIDGQVFCVDLESRTGVLGVDGSFESGWLLPGQTILIGPYAIRLAAAAGDTLTVGGEPPVSPLLARSSESADMPKVSLEFQSRTAGHSVWRMPQLLALVGSSSRCKVRLLDSNVSNLHCALLRTPRGLWVVDLLGRGGITVNGASVRFAPLGPLDVLRLGQVVVRTNIEASLVRGETSTPPTQVWGVGPTRPWGQPGGIVRHEHAFLPDRVPVEAPAPSFPTGLMAQGDPALGQLLDHFSRMQQQTMEQFQQMMMMMMQMFGGMHKEQMSLVRQEMAKLGELNGEVAAIKAELAARPLAPPAPLPAPARAPVAPPKLAQGQVGSPAGGGNGERPAAANPRGAWPNAGATRAGQARGTGSKEATGQGGAGRADEPKPAPTPVAPLPPPPPEIHEWLNERLTTITQEQQTRWQKIMSLIRGGG